jgi:hypothetical protein
MRLIVCQRFTIVKMFLNLNDQLSLKLILCDLLLGDLHQPVSSLVGHALMHTQTREGDVNGSGL